MLDECVQVFLFLKTKTSGENELNECEKITTWTREAKQRIRIACLIE